MTLVSTAPIYTQRARQERWLAHEEKSSRVRMADIYDSSSSPTDHCARAHGASVGMIREVSWAVSTLLLALLLTNVFSPTDNGIFPVDLNR